MPDTVPCGLQCSQQQQIRERAVSTRHTESEGCNDCCIDSKSNTAAIPKRVNSIMVALPIAIICVPLTR
jgi:hypothetical protein